MSGITILNLGQAIALTGQEYVEIVQGDQSKKAQLFQLAQAVAIVQGVAPLTLSGGFALNFSLSAATNLTLPTSGTVAALGSAQSWTATQSFQGSGSSFGSLVYSEAQVSNVVNTAPAVTQAVYIGSGPSTIFIQNAANNFVFNLTFAAGVTLDSVLGSGQSARLDAMVLQGATPYVATAVQVDGNIGSVTVVWSNGGPPAAGGANGVDRYSFFIVKVAPATFYVLASVTSYTV